MNALTHNQSSPRVGRDRARSDGRKCGNKFGAPKHPVHRFRRPERLRVNADVAPSGNLKIAVRLWSQKDDLPWHTFADSDRLIGNSLPARLTWKGREIIDHKGQPIMLRVRMNQAKLFGFEFD
jgi:hypothetical protein